MRKVCLLNFRLPLPEAQVPLPLNRGALRGKPEPVGFLSTTKSLKHWSPFPAKRKVHHSHKELVRNRKDLQAGEGLIVEPQTASSIAAGNGGAGETWQGERKRWGLRQDGGSSDRHRSHRQGCCL